MEQVLISKVEDVQKKDNASGFIFKSVGYRSSVNNDKFYMIGVGSCIFPDVFEMNKTDFEQHNKIQNVVRLINNISINSYAIHRCPFCKSPIAHLDKQLICFNINCIVDDSPTVIVLYKLQMLLDNKYTAFVAKNMDKMIELNKIITVVSVIQFIRAYEFTEDDDIETQTLFDVEISCLPLNRFLSAISGSDFKGLYRLITKYYDNSIDKMINDIPTVFEPLHNLGIPHELRILLFNMFTVNKLLLDYIIP